jgi:VWFA-related protein
MLLMFVVLFGAVGSSSLQQVPGSEEVRVRSSAYWPRSQFAVRVDTRLVEVGVVVRNAHGRTIGGLSRNDFEIEDSGKKRDITAFSIESFIPAATTPVVHEKPAVAAPTSPAYRPRFVALLFDDFSMGPAELAQVKTAAKRFLKQGLSTGDRIAIFTMSNQQVVPFTDDVPKLVAAVDKFTIAPRVSSTGICPTLTPYDAYIIANGLDQSVLELKVAELRNCKTSTRYSSSQQQSQTAGTGGIRLSGPDVSSIQGMARSLWERVSQISLVSLGAIEDVADYMSHLPGSRMILLASSGFLAATLEREQDEVVNHALRSGVVINALDAKGLYADEPVVATPGATVESITRMARLGTVAKDINNDVMVTLAAGTGGLFFHNNNDLDLGFHELGVVPEVSYMLGFEPGALDGRYHKLKVRLKTGGSYSVQARPGYWALPSQPPLQERSVDREIVGIDTLAELPAVIAAVRAQTDNGEPALQVVLHLDPRQFHFVMQGDVRTQKLTFIAALFDDGGNFITGKECEIEFALKEDTFNKMAEQGLNASLTLQALPGAYRLRGVVQDGVDGKILASSLPVEIR